MDWLEILVPIIFVAIWILSAIFGRGQDSEDEPRRPRGRPRPEEDEVPEEVRRLQDEIRRKIHERQTGESGTSPSRPEPTPAPVASRRSEQPPPSRPRPATVSGGGDPVQQGMIHYEEELAKRMREVKASQERVSRVRKEHGHGIRDQGMRRRPSVSDSSPLRGDVLREIIRDPQGARKAFLYLEILGQPVGMRERGAIRPPWES